MRNRIPDEATCPICGRHFDPSETRGWCTNPSCGQWQHPRFPLEEEGSRDDSPGSGTGGVGTETSDVETGTDEEDPEGLECPDCGADLSGIPADRLSTCPICMSDLEALRPADGAKPTDTTSRPEPSQADDVSPRTDPSPSEGVDERIDDRSPIDAVDGIAPGYAQRLKDAGIQTVGDLVSNHPDDISARTGVSTRRIRGWIDSVPVDPPAGVETGGESQPTGGKAANTSSGPADRDSRSGPAVGGHERGPAGKSTEEDATMDAHETRIERSVPELVLHVKGQTLSIEDGDAVGSEIRNAMVEAGEPQEEAVYVHREHARFAVENDVFTVTRLGENSLTINGRPVDKGTSRPINDGDEIEFSGVVTATVSIR